MKQPLRRPLLAFLRIDRRRVAAEHDHFHALQAHHPIGLRPAPIVADRHAEDASHGAPDWKAGVARLEIAFLEMLKGARGIEFRTPRQMSLATFSDDLR